MARFFLHELMGGKAQLQAFKCFCCLMFYHRSPGEALSVSSHTPQELGGHVALQNGECLPDLGFFGIRNISKAIWGFR